ncbi:MAG: CPBP family intramembrane metalloprotease [Anaerolineales bacterium]|nr:CPBP family intramembrane metalloprotease [Anaerolineales bacterium]
MSAERESASALPISAVVPGLLLVFGIESLVLARLVAYTPRLQVLLSALMTAAPWAAIWCSRKGIGALGYKRERILVHLGWGMVAGGFWRVASVLLNLLGLELTGILQGSLQILTHMLWIPLIEETFFRGYLGRALIRRWGFVSGVLLQAAAFALLPSHVSQGGWSILSIFAFGLLAGWLMHQKDSIWAVWGAHAFANFLPLLAQAVW